MPVVRGEVVVDELGVPLVLRLREPLALQEAGGERGVHVAVGRLGVVDRLRRLVLTCVLSLEP